MSEIDDDVPARSGRAWMGDALTLRLERDCYVAVTACPASVANGGGGGGPLSVTIGDTVG